MKWLKRVHTDTDTHLFAQSRKSLRHSLFVSPTRHAFCLTGGVAGRLDDVDADVDELNGAPNTERCPLRTTTGTLRFNAPVNSIRLWNLLLLFPVPLFLIYIPFILRCLMCSRSSVSVLVSVCVCVCLIHSAHNCSTWKKRKCVCVCVCVCNASVSTSVSSGKRRKSAKKPISPISREKKRAAFGEKVSSFAIQI